LVSVPNPGAVPASNQLESGVPKIHVAQERLDRPRLAPEVELVGRMQDIAFEHEQWLICFEDSNYIQATPLLYHVLVYSDGSRTTDEIARDVNAAAGSELTGEDVDWLVRNRLIPAGMLDLGISEDDEEFGPGPRLAEVPVLGLR
jgi:hypothetical protein